MFSRGRRYCWLLLLTFPCARAQNAAIPDTSTQRLSALPPPSVAEKWAWFESETESPFMLVSAGSVAVVSQWLRYPPVYGNHFWRDGAFPKRFGATVGDDISQNFLAEFVLASALHEDTRYVRKGPSHGMWPRIGYAISRAVIARTDSGAATFNWANVGGCGMSAALSNAYYPPANRTASVAAVNWGTNIAGAGLTNLLPEFGSDVGQWMKQHLPFHH